MAFSTLDVILIIIIGLLLGGFFYFELRPTERKYTQEEFDQELARRLNQQRATVKGNVGENIAPHMREFIEKYEPADARYLGGKPVDYIVYKGYSRVKDTDEPIDAVVFVEVKTSKNATRGLDRNERKIKEAILNGKVEHDTIILRAV